jgi:hypothetical protein
LGEVVERVAEASAKLGYRWMVLKRRGMLSGERQTKLKGSFKMKNVRHRRNSRIGVLN